MGSLWADDPSSEDWVEEGYDLSDPKHPTFHDRYADQADLMRKREKEDSMDFENITYPKRDEIARLLHDRPTDHHDVRCASCNERLCWCEMDHKDSDGWQCGCDAEFDSACITLGDV